MIDDGGEVNYNGQYENEIESLEAEVAASVAEIAKFKDKNAKMREELESMVEFAEELMDEMESQNCDGQYNKDTATATARKLLAESEAEDVQDG